MSRLETELQFQGYSIDSYHGYTLVHWEEPADKATAWTFELRALPPVSRLHDRTDAPVGAFPDPHRGAGPTRADVVRQIDQLRQDAANAQILDLAAPRHWLICWIEEGGMGTDNFTRAEEVADAISKCSTVGGDYRERVLAWLRGSRLGDVMEHPMGLVVCTSNHATEIQYVDDDQIPL